MRDLDPDAVIGQIVAAFAACGHLDYGERISMREHMLQSAYLAEQDGADDALIVATLLHDYGHLICNLPNNTFAEGRDNYHEKIGADALAGWFDEKIADAVRLHVDAKRYLCAMDPEYLATLSDASKVTLSVQGGPMTAEEIRNFEAKPGHELALSVRLYDDSGKVQGMQPPQLDHYLPRIRACLKPQDSGSCGS